MKGKNNYPLKKSEKDWRAELSEEEFRILRQKGTELPFSGEYNDHYEEGAYLCKGCGKPLYLSESKFNANGETGLPDVKQTVIDI